MSETEKDQTMARQPSHIEILEQLMDETSMLFIQEACAVDQVRVDALAAAIAALRVQAGVAGSSPLPGSLSEQLDQILRVMFDAWDSDQDHRVGKMIKALAGLSPGYRPDIDQFRAQLESSSAPGSVAAARQTLLETIGHYGRMCEARHPQKTPAALMAVMVNLDALQAALRPSSPSGSAWQDIASAGSGGAPVKTTVS